MTKKQLPEAAQEDDDLRRFADCWNNEQFFDAHEALEPRWIKTRDRGLRGLIQLAAAFHHLKRGNLVGARTTLERAMVRLADTENAPCDIDQKAFAKYAEGVLAALATTPLADIIASRPTIDL
ncbi:MAG: DUF309 domain-containing protein [Candidatus Eremiobacteraeota bacterium]|nr:DUF309 domain-containing protein [Candidatus Eremiobacteraeota bacterium]